MCIPVKRTSTLLGLVFLASAASLALALTSEYGFGLKPCELCLFQRIPYVAIMVLAVAGYWLRSWRFALCVAIGFCFMVDSGIAAYHTGVEKHWIPGPEACTDENSGKPMSVEEILAKIHAAPIVACDQPQWEFHGFTMASLNAIWAFMLALGSFAALHQIRKTEKADAQTAR